MAMEPARTNYKSLSHPAAQEGALLYHLPDLQGSGAKRTKYSIFWKVREITDL